MLDSSQLLSARTKSYLRIRQKASKDERKRERERERRWVASGGLWSRRSISPAPGLLPWLLMLLPREGGEITFDKFGCRLPHHTDGGTSDVTLWNVHTPGIVFDWTGRFLQRNGMKEGTEKERRSTFHQICCRVQSSDIRHLGPFHAHGETDSPRLNRHMLVLTRTRHSWLTYSSYRVFPVKQHFSVALEATAHSAPGP